MRHLMRKEFVQRERASSIAGESQYAFRHMAVREVAYGQLPRARRAERHQITAEWLESLTTGSSDELVELLAHHYLSAIELGRVAGRDVRSSPGLRARRPTARVSTHPRSTPTAPRPISIRPPSSWPSATTPSAQGFCSASARRSSMPSRVAPIGSSRLAEALLVLGDVERAAVADVLLATLFVNRGSLGVAQEHLERATALLRDVPSTRAKVYVLSTRARFLVAPGKPEDAIAVGREALAMAEELGLDDLRAQALDNVGVARLARGDNGAREDFERSLAVSEAIRSPESHARLPLSRLDGRAGGRARARLRALRPGAASS